MAKGLSLHIGLNFIDAKHYKDESGNPWNGQLNACENDARSMQELANSQGFKSTILLREKAICNAVLDEIQSAAKSLNSGDFFFLTYSGHGSQILDFSGDEPANEARSESIIETGGKDETYCFYDRQFLDDEMNGALSEFKEGVRVLVLSDCCHSGTNVRDVSSTANTANENELPAARQLSLDASIETVKANPITYENFWEKDTLKASAKLKSSVLLLSGCQDSQLSRDGKVNGAFTEALIKAWDKGNFQGTYRQLQHAIIKLIPKEYHQTPNYFLEGKRNTDFELQQAFTI